MTTLLLRWRPTPRPVVFRNGRSWWVVWLGRPVPRPSFAEAVDLAAWWYAVTVRWAMPEAQREAS